MPSLPHRSAEATVTAAESERRVREAYQRGRKDANVMGRTHPWLGIATIVLAIAGGAALSVAASNGAFSPEVRPAVASAAMAAEPGVHGLPD